MTATKSSLEMVDEANTVVECIGIEQAQKLVDDDSVLFVDIRDIRELWREGTIPGAMSAPRGMLEFWFDPTCQYHRKEFSSDRKIILFCASAWRSALSARDLQNMGFEHIAHMTGGFSAWKKAGFPVQKVEPRKPKS